jgi:hypothetical protein
MLESPQGFRAGDQNLYRYVANDPENATDPTGLFKLAYDFVTKPIGLKDGAFETSIRWKLDQPPEKGGVIIQRVSYAWIVEDANGKPVEPNNYFLALVAQGQFSTFNYPYMEAWVVAPGQTETTVVQEARKKGNNNPYDDLNNSPAFSDPQRPTKGTLVAKFEAKFYDGYSPPEDFKVHNRPPTGQLPAKLGLTIRDDHLFTVPGHESNTVTRQYQVTWDSLKGPSPSILKVT